MAKWVEYLVMAGLVIAGAGMLEGYNRYTRHQTLEFIKTQGCVDLGPPDKSVERYFAQGFFCPGNPPAIIVIPK